MNRPWLPVLSMVLLWSLSLLVEPESLRASERAPDDKEQTEDSAKDEDGFGSGRTSEPDTKSRSTRRKRSSRDEKAEAAAKKDEASEEDDPKAKPKEEDAEESGDDSGFGSGRAKPKVKSLDEDELANDKDKERYVRALKKKFKNERGHYVLMTLEEGYEENQNPQNDPNAPRYQPYRKIQFEVLSGQEEAVAFVVGFVSEYETPWARKPKTTSSRRKRGEEAQPEGPPKPHRDWQVLEMFANEADARAFREVQEIEYSNRERAAKEAQAPGR